MVLSVHCGLWQHWYFTGQSRRKLLKVLWVPIQGCYNRHNARGMVHQYSNFVKHRLTVHFCRRAITCCVLDFKTEHGWSFINYLSTPHKGKNIWKHMQSDMHNITKGNKLIKISQRNKLIMHPGNRVVLNRSVWGIYARKIWRLGKGYMMVFLFSCEPWFSLQWP